MNPFVIAIICVCFFVMGKFSSEEKTKTLFFPYGLLVIFVLSLLLVQELQS